MSIKDFIRRWLLNDDHKEARVTRDLQTEDRPSTTTPVRTFAVHEAMNGKYITFTRRKFNSNGPDEYRSEMYIVQPDESLIDAISTVLVLMEK